MSETNSTGDLATATFSLILIDIRRQTTRDKIYRLINVLCDGIRSVRQNTINNNISILNTFDEHYFENELFSQRSKSINMYDVDTF